MMAEAIADDSYQRDTRLGSDVADYLAWARFHLAARSLVIYEGYLAALCNTIAAKNPAMNEVTVDHLLEGLQKHGLASYRVVKSAYGGFFAWGCLQGRCERNPVLQLPKPPRLPEKVYDVFALTEQALLVKAADRSPMPRLERLRVLCLVELGVRKDEARWFRPEDFDPVAKVVVVTHGKGGKQRIVPMGDDLWRAFVQYRNSPVPRVRVTAKGETWHEDRLPRDDDWIFFPYGATKTGRVTWTDPRSQWSSRSMHNWWERTVAAAGVKYRSMHLARHTVGTDLATAEADAFTIRDWLGHADVSTTQTYVHNSRSRLNTGRGKLDEFRKGHGA